MSAPPPQSSSGLFPPPLSLADPLTGLIPYIAIAEIEKGDPDVFVSASDTADTLAYGLPHKVTSKGSGAGLTYAAAWGAAVGEGIERYAFSIIHPEDLHFGSFQKLRARGLEPVAPNRWALYDDSQLANLPLPPFREETPVAWTPAESLTHRRDCLVPACMVNIPYTPLFAEQGEQVVTFAISTGSACARSRAEALLKGLCELIERDAFMIFWRNRLPLPRVQIDPKSALYDIFHTKFDRSGLHYTLIHTTLDLKMPSFAGFVLDTRSDPPGIMVGGAAHPDPNRALLKTLLELVQGLKWKDFMQKTVTLEPDFRNIRSFEDRAHLYASNDLRDAFRFLWEHDREIALSDIPSLETGDVRRDLRNGIDLLAARDLETLGIDLTPADAAECGLYVTRVLVPGFETMEGDHLLPFLGGSRWREVPVRLGLLPSEPDIASINPYPHPYP